MTPRPSNGCDLLAVGPNPAVDVYYRLDRLCVGGVNRVGSLSSAAGGKANNLARAYRRLGGRPVTTGIVGGETGTRILDGLTAEGIAHDYVRGRGESRRTVTVVAGGATTVLLEPGPPAVGDELDALAATVGAWAPAVPAVAVGGSLPAGAPADYLARLVRLAREESRALVAVDATGEALRLAAESGPHLIKVNIAEFESAFRTPARDLPTVERLFRTLAGRGLATLCLTAGARGALVVTSGGCFCVWIGVDVRGSTAGAGDAFLAGLLFALRRGDEVRAATRFATAAAAAALQAVGAGIVERATVDAFLPRARVVGAESFFAEPGP